MSNVWTIAWRMLKLLLKECWNCPFVKKIMQHLPKWPLLRWSFSTEEEKERCQEWSVNTFKARKNSELDEDMAACVFPLQNKMCDFFTRVEIGGKQGRVVPVLLKPSMVSAMKLLAHTRDSCGVSKENIYMFARPGALSAYRGRERIQKFAREIGAKHPEVLTSTRLWKCIATMSQLLNLQENEADQLADFLGHDICMHRQCYLLPQGTLQLAKMSKVLLAMGNGTLSQV